MATKTHDGSCHCGAVTYQVELDTDGDALVCNCSICRRSGAMMMFVAPDKFQLTSGEDKLAKYTFNKHVIEHLFCGTCGIRPFGRGTGPQGPMVMINLRCLADVDVFTQKVHQFDGATA